MRKEGEELSLKIIRQGEKLRKAALEAAEENGKAALKRAKNYSPVRTGRLRHSLRQEKGRVFTFCPYARFVELGTRFMLPRFFLTRSFEEKSSVERFIKKGKKALL